MDGKNIIIGWGVFFAIIGGIFGFIDTYSEGIGLAIFMSFVAAAFFFVLSILVFVLRGLISIIFFPAIIILMIVVVIHSVFFADPEDHAEAVQIENVDD